MTEWREEFGNGIDRGRAIGGRNLKDLVEEGTWVMDKRQGSGEMGVPPTRK